MSEELNKNSRFDAMTSQQLEDLLRLDAEGAGDLDTDSLFYIMELLAARQAGDGRSIGEAYKEFQEEYLSPSEKRRTPSRWLAALGSLAAAVAVVVLSILLLRPAQQTVQPEKFQLQSLSSNTVAITDADGNCAAVGTISYDGCAITASIDAMDRDDDYSYYAIVTYSYCAAGTEKLTAEKFPLTTAEAGFEIRRVSCSPDRVAQVRSASASFYAVEKTGNAEAKLIATVTEFPIIEQVILTDKGFQ